MEHHSTHKTDPRVPSCRQDYNARKQGTGNKHAGEDERGESSPFGRPGRRQPCSHRPEEPLRERRAQHSPGCTQRLRYLTASPHEHKRLGKRLCRGRVAKAAGRLHHRRPRDDKCHRVVQCILQAVGQHTRQAVCTQRLEPCRRWFSGAASLPLRRRRHGCGQIAPLTHSPAIQAPQACIPRGESSARGSSTQTWPCTAQRSSTFRSCPGHSHPIGCGRQHEPILRGVAEGPNVTHCPPWRHSSPCSALHLRSSQRLTAQKVLGGEKQMLRGARLPRAKATVCRTRCLNVWARARRI